MSTRRCQVLSAVVGFVALLKPASGLLDGMSLAHDALAGSVSYLICIDDSTDSAGMILRCNHLVPVTICLVPSNLVGPIVSVLSLLQHSKMLPIPRSSFM